MSVEDVKAVNLPEIAKFSDQESCVAAHMKEGLSEAAARRICGHLPSKKSSRKVSFSYQATFEPYEEQGKRLAKIHVIDLAPNKNDWQVTAPARAKALKTLLDSPLLGPPPDGEKGNVIGGPPGSPHEGLWSPVGKFVDFSSNHVTHGIAEITKDYAWQKIKSGEWNAVSPSVLAFLEHREGDVDVVDDFNFEHVLFVDKGAYPAAGVESTCEGTLGSCGFYNALAAAAERQGSGFSITDQDLSVMEKAVQSARGILTALEERLEIILHGKPEPEPTVPPLPLASHTVVSDGEMNPERPSPSPNQTQGLENKLGQKMEGGNEMKTTQASTFSAAPLTTEQRNKLSDSDFAYIDSDGGRHLPIHDADHVRAALGGDGFSAQSFESDAAKAEAKKKICAAAKKFDIESELCGTKGGMHQSKEEQEMNECNELQARIKELEPQVIALKAENESLKAFKAEVEKKARMAKVQSIVELKTRCGMLEPKDHAQAFSELEKLSADALDAVEKELTVVQARVESMPSGPKAKHTAEQAYSTIEDIRQAMFGYRRDEKGQIIGGQ
jgi:transposase-like protein